MRKLHYLSTYLKIQKCFTDHLRYSWTYSSGKRTLAAKKSSAYKYANAETTSCKLMLYSNNMLEPMTLLQTNLEHSNR